MLSRILGDQPRPCTRCTLMVMRLLITESILECLDTFRGRRPGAAFWIDAVCINQKDLGERAAQVQLMRYVFSQAMEVWVWLGSSQSPVRELVRGIRGAADLPHSLTDEHGKRFICQVSLLSQLEWWYRVWTVQEIVLSKHIRLWYGDIAVTVSDLWSWRGDMLDLMDRQQDLGSRASDTNQLGHCVNHISRLRFRQNLLPRMQSVDPRRREIESLRILAESRAASSLDVRDRVYGQLAIFETVLQAEIVPPDYTVSASNAYINFAFHWCRINESLNILNQVSSSRNSMLALPTWVPDWSSRDSFNTELHRLSARRQYRASRNAVLVNPILTPDSKLHISGLEIDDIKTLSTVREATAVPTSKDERASLMRRADLWKRFYHDAIKETQCPGSLCTGYSCITTSFIRTIFRDIITTPDDPRGRRISEDSEAMKALDCFQEVESSAMYDYHSRRCARLSISEATASSRFFVTSGGRPGLGPPDIQAGDCVVVLTGGEVPYILRKSQQRSFFTPQNVYSFIGECYVHAAMDGQLFDESLVHDIWLE